MAKFKDTQRNLLTFNVFAEMVFLQVSYAHHVLATSLHAVDAAWETRGKKQHSIILQCVIFAA